MRDGYKVSAINDIDPTKCKGYPDHIPVVKCPREVSQEIMPFVFTSPFLLQQTWDNIKLSFNINIKILWNFVFKIIINIKILQKVSSISKSISKSKFSKTQYQNQYQNFWKLKINIKININILKILIFIIKNFWALKVCC